MEIIKLENINNFNSAKSAIETAKDSLTLVVKKVKSSSDPDLTKPYTKYDESDLLIHADEFVKEVLDKASITYSVYSVTKDLIDKLTAAAEASGLAVPFESFYYKNRYMILDFISNGDITDIKELFNTATEAWLDMRETEADPSPREFAQGLIQEYLH